MATKTDSPKKQKPSDKKKFHEEAMARFKRAKEAWSKVHADYVADQRFANGDQWDAKLKSTLTLQGLSALTYNQLPAKVKYIVNNARQNTPAIKCNPIGDGSSRNTAKIYDGVIKHIQYKYDAKHAYINALSGIVIGGLGAWKVLPIQEDEADPITGELEPTYDISIERITDPTGVYMDPAAKKQNFCDAEFCFLLSWMDKDEAKELYPDALLESVEKDSKSLFNKHSVAILEYWVKNEDTGLFEQYLMTGEEILTENKAYRGKYCPIVLVTGEEKHIEGEREYKGIVRDVKDMQILLNLSKSKTADYIARATNVQWKATASQIAGYEDIWRDVNTAGVALLPYHPDASGSPERMEPPSPPTGFMQASAEADADIRAAIGIRDPLADVPVTQSGKAIQLQVAQGNIGTYEYTDKLNAAIKYTGTILVDLIPFYFSYPHIREIMGLDGQVTTVPLNQMYEENGQVVMHDLAAGKYSVTLDDGPSYESQRSEASDMLLECVSKYPEFMHIAGDIVFRNLNFEGAQEIADRLKATIPPNVLAAGNATNGDSASQTAQMQAGIAQMQQELQQAQAAFQQAQAMIAQLTQEKQAKIVEIQTRGQVEKDLAKDKFQYELQLKHLDVLANARAIEEKAHVESARDIAKINAEAEAAASMTALEHDHDVEMHGHTATTDVFHKRLDASLRPTPLGG